MLDPGERVLEQPVGGSKIALAGAADELAHRLECVLVGLRRGKDRRLKRVLNVAEDASCVLDLRAARELAIARRCLAAVAHACHAIGAGCGWLRCLANAPHHPEGRHKLLEDGCRYALATRGRGGRLPSAPLRSAPVKQLPREADHASRILCK